ncbi:MAG: nucleotidyl transferase AbiEii/AbiGii toxin family protein [Planctomycetaceae bacterium]|jgi:predicted nucleotidyltransferase component of viral defense system|nr:nucleotidyl transferase AbiEii/AbiGii toxin family protein [Planctomycetaceae bacterium]
MKNNVFDEMFARYSPTTKEEKQHAIHEVMQEITLAGLYRAGFFDHAAFYGGTCLRIFYGMQRFSEDMDFSLLRTDENFRLENYFDAIKSEFQAVGREITISKKEKRIQTNVESAFLKDTTEIYNLRVSNEKSVKIKIEVDTQPPMVFSTEHKLLMLPFSFLVRCYVLPDLYAGKMHALLFRNWKNRVKGRDWYDFEWYIRNNIPLNFEYLQQRTEQTNSIAKNDFTAENFKKLLKERILKTDINAVKNDVRPFIKNPAAMDIWSNDYFLQLVDRIKMSE